ncbi:membrane hypothetical protein [Verrucomicrobia bacterium]|nr:membrane hypothetical protein [Verrucomicrobiota bacterium]
MSAPPSEVAAPGSAPLPATAPAGAPQLRPTFLGAWRGIWLFTWRSRLTWRRIPLALLGLLAIPLLLYITVSSPRTWALRHPLLGSPVIEADNVGRRLRRAGMPLEPDQQTQLHRIFAEEFGRAENGLVGTESAGLDSRKGQVQACYDRITERVRTVLDERQFEQFKATEERHRDAALARLNEPSWAGSGLSGPRMVEEAAWGRTGAFYHWLVDFYFFVVLPLSCVSANGALIREELQADTLGFLLTRPMSRARLLAVKYLSQSAWLELALVLETLLLFAAGSLRQMSGLAALLPLFLGVQVLAVLAWSALGTLLGLVTRRFMALALVYGLIVEMGIGRIPTNINTLSLMRHLKTLLAHSPALQGVYHWSGEGVLSSLGALVLASVIFLLLAALLFTFREYHHTTEMQK